MRITRFKENGGSEYQDRGIDQERKVQCDGSVDAVEFKGLPYACVCTIYLTCLYQGRMQVKIVWHYGCSNDTDPNIKCFISQRTRNKTKCNLTEIRLRKNDFQQK